MRIIKAIASLGIVSILECKESADFTDALKSILENEESSSEVLVASLSGYGLMCPLNQPNEDAINNIVDIHLELLESKDVYVRIACGENLASMYEHTKSRNGGTAIITISWTFLLLYQQVIYYLPKIQRDIEQRRTELFRNLDSENF